MQPYANRSGRSGVVAYALEPDCIRVRFADGRTCEYAAAQIGAANLARMQELAREGRGLSSFIAGTREVREGFRRKRR